MSSTKPHVHKDLIIAWANGAQIQFLSKVHYDWVDCIHPPSWIDDTEYRIKPKAKVKKYRWVFSDGNEYFGVTAGHYSKDEEDKATGTKTYRFVQKIEASEIEVEED